MPAQHAPNIGSAMLQIHDAITRSMEVTKMKCQEFTQPSAEPDQSTRESFMLYVSTMVMVINAHHLSEDHIIFPRLKITLTQVPFDGLSADHKIMDVILAKLRQTLETPADNLFTSLLDTVTRLIELWTPHIAKEKKYIYSPEITAAFMSPEEHIKMLQDASKHALEQGNPALIIPFLLYNLNPVDRAEFAGFLPPEMTQTLLPGVWKQQWAPMLPFMLD
jgi:hemerythrin-like domain-containing protein